MYMLSVIHPSTRESFTYQFRSLHAAMQAVSRIRTNNPAPDLRVKLRGRRGYGV